MTPSSIAMLSALLTALPAADCSHLQVPMGPVAQVNDNCTPAGTLRGGELSVRVVVRRVSWYPDGPEGCGLNVLAFAEDAGVPSIPGPLIRV